jgi:four helix bundle protein
MGKSIVKQKSYEFALQIIRLCTQLKSDRHYEISSQLLRSGTSVGANVEEAYGGAKPKGFLC